MKIGILLLLFTIISLKVSGQCTTEGQTPATAFPVCATSVFHQDEVPQCVNHSIPVPGCERSRADYSDDSPFWYRFTCFRSGTLALLIQPANQEDDYDWELFDVTGHDPEDVYTDPSMVVDGNWAGVPGNTGAAADGYATMVCASARTDPKEMLFSKMPHLKKGHEYLLLVSHYSGSTQSGYDLSFDGGTAVITDTTAPKVDSVAVDCNGKSMTVYLNKEMSCKSLSLDGSDFEIADADVRITSAEGGDCKDGFGMQKLTLTLSQKLATGTYYLGVKNGKDHNTLLDNCGTPVPVGNQVTFTYRAPDPAVMDSLVEVGCAPQDIDVAFSQRIKSRSVATDGSDFKIENTQTGETVAIAAAENIENHQDSAHTVRIHLEKPIYTKGHYRLLLQKGSDGNTVVSECDTASTAGQYLLFETADTVWAKIVKSFHYSCNQVKVKLKNPGGNDISQWRWMIDSVVTGMDPSIEYRDTSFRGTNYTLDVSNGVCQDERSVRIVPDSGYYIHADFTSPDFVCPQDEVSLEDHSDGDHIVQWHWDYGDGRSSFRKTPTAFQYPATRFTKTYPVRLIVVNSRNCRDTVIKPVKVINTCDVYVPSAFSPNEDGHNDRLHPLNAYVAEKLVFSVYNRYGQKVYQSHDWTRGWNGKYKGEKAPSGAYIWTLRFINSRTGKKVSRKGSSLLIR